MIAMNAEKDAKMIRALGEVARVQSEAERVRRAEEEVVANQAVEAEERRAVALEVAATRAAEAEAVWKVAEEAAKKATKLDLRRIEAEDVLRHSVASELAKQEAGVQAQMASEARKVSPEAPHPTPAEEVQHDCAPALR